MYCKTNGISHRSLIYFIAMFSILCSCKPQQYTMDDLPKERLEFGSGGGVVGKVDTYTLLDNGQLFLTNSLTQETRELEGFSKKEAKTFFERVKGPEISELEFDHPGNLYYFINHITENKEHRLVWGSADHTVPVSCKAFYQDVMATVKRNNP